MTERKLKEYPVAVVRLVREVPTLMPGPAKHQLATLIHWIRWIHKMPESQFNRAIGRTKSPFEYGPNENPNAVMLEACHNAVLWVIDSLGLSTTNERSMTADFVMLLEIPVAEGMEADWRAVAKAIQKLASEGEGK